MTSGSTIRSLGRFVASHFEDERAQIRALIETQLSYLPSASQDFESTSCSSSRPFGQRRERFTHPRRQHHRCSHVQAAGARRGKRSGSYSKSRPHLARIGKTVFVAPPFEAEPMPRSRSSVPVQVPIPSETPSTPHRTTGGRYPWAIIGAGLTAAVILIVAFVRVTRPSDTSTPLARPVEVLLAASAPRSDEPKRPETLPRERGADHLATDSAEKASGDSKAESRQVTAVGHRPPVHVAPAQPPGNTRPVASAATENIYDVDLREVRKQPRTIDEVSPY